MSHNLPVIYQQSSFINGPELRDPRLNLDYAHYLRNRLDGEQFWVKYISENPVLQEVRWDIFEDGLHQFLQDVLVFDAAELTKINWRVFFNILFENLANNEEDPCLNPVYPVPTSFQNCRDKYLKYTGKKVRKSDWINFIQNIGFTDYAKKCVVDEQDVDEEGERMRNDKLIKKIMKLKTVKKGVVLYEDGSVYEGERENGRCHGKGKFISAHRKGTYEGEFRNGKRHGYGTQTSHTVMVDNAESKA